MKGGEEVKHISSSNEHLAREIVNKTISGSYYLLVEAC
jgi:hypothetical protein